MTSSDEQLGTSSIGIGIGESQFLGAPPASNRQSVIEF